MNAAELQLREALSARPIVAILRGVTPDEAVSIGSALADAGVRVAEVPLNSPDPFESIRRLKAQLGQRMVIGAGTVTTLDALERIAEVGAQICVAPNTDGEIISAALGRGLAPIPGVATPTEAFEAVRHGARLLKIFPAGVLGDRFISALAAVLPADVRMLAVGGVTSDSAPSFLRAGCVGVGLGAEVYVAGLSASAVASRARRVIEAMAPLAPAPSDQVRIQQCAAVEAHIGESVLFDRRSREILWIDAGQRVLFAFDPSSHTTRRIALETPLWAIKAAPSGELIGLGADGLCRVDARSGACSSFAAVIDARAECRLNDGVVDPRGRLWVGSMSRLLQAGRGALFRIDLEGRSTRVRDGFGVCNGMAFSPDARSLYVVDTLHRTLLAFDYDLESGELGAGRAVTDFMQIDGKPDGAAVAADGAVWVAMWGGGCLVRIAPTGEVLQRIDLPTPNVSSCCFDPREPNRLYVATSRIRLSREQLAAAPWSGSLLCVDLPR